MAKEATQEEHTPLDVASGADKIFGLLSEDLDSFEDQQVEEDGGEIEVDEADEADDTSEVEEDADDVDADYDDDQDDDEADDEAEEEPEEPAEPTYKVKVDGEEDEVTLDEALRGYQRQATWTKRMQALAAERETIQQTSAEVAQKRQEYLDRLAVVETALKGGMTTEPDWAQLKKENPTRYAEMRAAHQEQTERVQQIQAEQARVRTEMQQQFEAERDRVLAIEAERLDAAIPEWGTDPDLAQAEKRKLADFALNTYGFAPKDLESVVDHRVVLLLRDALRYNEMQSKGKDAQAAAKKGRKKSPTLRPGTTKTQSTGKSKKNPARSRLAQSGSVSDAAAVLFDMIE
jgi:hypothetical protein